MKKLLIFVPFAIIFIFAILYRGGISLHSHFLWAGLLFIPATTMLFSRQFITKNKYINLANASLLLFTITFFLSIILAPINEFGIYDFLAYISGVTTFFIISQKTFEEQTVEKIFTFLVASASGLSAAGLVFYMFLSPTRVFGTFVDFNMLAVSFPNAFALFLLMIMPITTYKLLSSENSKLKLYTLAAIIQFSTFILTFSRESWLIFLLAIIIGAVIAFKKYKNISFLGAKRIILVFLIAVLLAYGCSLFRSLNFNSQNVYNKITFQADEGKVSYTDRLDLFKTSFKVFTDHPLIGYGPGAFEKLAQNHQHNMFLKIINDSGVFALIFFMAFLIFISLSVKKPSSYTIIIGTSVVLALGQNMVDFNLNFVSNSLLFWGFLGMLTSFQPKTKKQISGYKNIYIILAALLSLILLFVSIHETFYKLRYKEGQNLYKNEKYEEALQAFSSAKPLFFKQNLPYLMGKTYIRLVEKNPEYSNKGISYMSAIPENEKSPEIKMITSELCLINEKKDCLTWATPVLKKSYEYAKNNLNLNKNIRVYYDYLAALYKSETDYEIKNMMPEIYTFLAQYQLLIEKNEQLAITTENPEYALKIYDLIIDFSKKFKEPDKEINKIVLSKAKLNRAITNEKRKYKTLYGQEPEIIE